MPPRGPEGPGVLRRRLGAELRRLREDAGLLIDDAAAVLDCSASKISRLETGKGVPKVRDVRDLLTRYGVSDSEVRSRLMRWADAGGGQGWWQEFSSVMQQESLTAHLQDYVALEADAIRKWEFQASCLPGLLQTADYARALLKVIPYDFSSAHVDQLVELRLRRQDVLVREGFPLDMHCVIDEAALLRPVGGRNAMAAQLERVIERAELPNVDIRVLPFAVGEHPAFDGSFEILQFADTSDSVVNVESLTGNAHLDGELDVKRYHDAFKSTAAMALDQERSMQYIASVMRHLR